MHFIQLSEKYNLIKVFLISIIILDYLSLNVCCKKISPTKLHTLNLDHDKVKMSWLIDWSKKEVLFHVQNVFEEKYKWFSLGFSKRGDFAKSDLCFFQQSDGFYHKEGVDTYTSDDGETIYVDEVQDCKIFRIDDNSVAFKRKFDTCDPDDLKMHEGTMYLLWSRGEDDIDFSNGSIERPNVTHKDGGSHMLQLLRADVIEIAEKNVKKIDIILDHVKVPSVETTYWCKIQKLDDMFKYMHHIVQFAPIIKTDSLVHHMEVFHCDTDPNIKIPLYNGDCKDMPAEGKVCSKVMALWAMGAGTFTYPAEAGLPIGGKNFNPFIRLEAHFNNPDLIADKIENTGMRIKVVSNLRKYDAAIMELGLEYTDKMAIPPNQVAFPLSGHCIAECTKLALPEKGIMVFGSQLHTHLRGVRVLTRHFRGETELKELNRDDYYSHHYQEIRQLRHRSHVLPGDALVTTCYYDTRGYKNATLGGFSISDEMCVNYIHYYPSTKLEVCKSSISEQSLHDYFEYMREKEHQPNIQMGNGRSANYRAIEWTQPRVDELFTMYIQDPLSMQCNQSDGNRFPGYDWEDAPITPVKIQMPIDSYRFCKNVFPPAKWSDSIQNGLCDMFGDCIY